MNQKVTDKICIIVIEDIHTLTGKKRVVAQKGRLGWIDKEDKLKIGTTTYVRVNLDGNYIRRDLPAWKLSIYKSN